MSRAKASADPVKAARTTLTEAINRGRGIERPFNCPSHDDTNASASLNIVKNVWYCFACGATGRATERRKAPSTSDVLEVLARRQKPRVFDERWLDVYDATGPSPYWERRVGETVATANRCGTDPMTGFPTYPIRSPNGQVWGVVYRTLGDPSLPKYLYPPAVSTSQTLFGYSRSHTGRPIVLVEGASDAMAVQAAFWARGESVVVYGCYGAGLHAPQIDLVAALKPSRIVTAFDADDAGKKATARAVVAAATHAIPFATVELADHGLSDPGEADVSVLHDIITEALRRHL